MKARRLHVWVRDSGMCVYCGDNVSLNEFTVDHIIPRSAGGQDLMHNMAVSCKACNSEKADKLLPNVDLQQVAAQRRRSHLSKETMRQRLIAQYRWLWTEKNPR